MNVNFPKLLAVVLCVVDAGVYYATGYALWVPLAWLACAGISARYVPAQ
jgi:uncharacterized membrane protein